MTNEEKFDTALNKILRDTKYFLKQVGDNEGNIYKGTLLPKIDGKKRDYLSRMLNPLANAVDALKDKVLPRSNEELEILVEETITNLNKIMEEIRLHDGNPINKNDLSIEGETVEIVYNFLFFPDPEIVDNINLIYKVKMQNVEEIRLQNSKPISKSNLVIDTHKIFKYNKKDVLILTYYSLIELYSEYGYYKKDFKSQALDKIKYKFGQTLAGNTLEVSLLSIKSDTNVLSPKNIPSTKFSYPTYGVTI